MEDFGSCCLLVTERQAVVVVVVVVVVVAVAVGGANSTCHSLAGILCEKRRNAAMVMNLTLVGCIFT